LGTFLVITTESQCEGTHEGNELLGGEVALRSETLHDETASMGLSTVLDCISFGADIHSSTLENHGGATTVLNSSVATELDEIRGAE